MLDFFIPSLVVEKVNDITIDMLEYLQVKILFVDVDNTLALHGSPEPFKGSVLWVESLKRAGYSAILISNNSKKRVEPFARKYDLPFISFAKKPLPFAFNKAKKIAGIKELKNEDCLVVGDQIFTDIVGANLNNMKSILVEPARKEKGMLFSVKRRIETLLLKKIKLNKACCFKGDDNSV